MTFLGGHHKDVNLYSWFAALIPSSLSVSWSVSSSPLEKTVPEWTWRLYDLLLGHEHKKVWWSTSRQWPVSSTSWFLALHSWSLVLAFPRTARCCLQQHPHELHTGWQWTNQSSAKEPKLNTGTGALWPSLWVLAKVRVGQIAPIARRQFRQKA